jgi:hypothetical protein
MTPALASVCTARASLQITSPRCLRSPAVKRGYRTETSSYPLQLFAVPRVRNCRCSPKDAYAGEHETSWQSKDGPWAMRRSLASHVLHRTEWNWPDESGHIWEAQSPHLLYANKCLKINTLDKEVLQGSIKSAFSKPLQIKGSIRKMGSYKLPNVSTVMWPSPHRESREMLGIMPPQASAQPQCSCPDTSA